MKSGDKKKLRVVLDTNIYVSAFLFPGGNPEEILKLALIKEIKVFISDDIIKEFIKILKSKFNYSEEVIKRFVNLIESLATITKPGERVKIIKKHKADNRILECALAAQADYLITGDKKHLLPLGKFRGIKIVSPEQFLKAISRP